MADTEHLQKVSLAYFLANLAISDKDLSEFLLLPNIDMWHFTRYFEHVNAYKTPYVYIKSSIFFYLHVYEYNWHALMSYFTPTAM